MVVEIGWYGAGALALFVTLGAYYAAQRHPALPGRDGGRVSFVAPTSWWPRARWPSTPRWRSGAALQEDPRFFSSFYTCWCWPTFPGAGGPAPPGAYHLIFRNSGLAASTVVLRLALTAPPAWSAALGAAAGLFALAVTLTCNRFAAVFEATAPRHDEG
ncbi:MAG: hypothetical protein IPO09_18805 [Anaeromyxobacter sp.]|nr:hypothetical protein [Anaeromyxobacter sp.]